MLCIKNGTVHDGVHREGFQADILVEDGKIKAIGENLEIPGDAEVVDADGLQVYPGFVEAHGHIGLDGYGIGYEGMDYNEMNDILSPQMRGIDGVKPMDPAFPKAAAAGVTCVCTGPGQCIGRHFYHHQDCGQKGGRYGSAGRGSHEVRLWRESQAGVPGQERLQPHDHCRAAAGDPVQGQRVHGEKGGRRGRHFQAPGL